MHNKDQELVLNNIMLREEGCMRCLSMHAKHANIIQYKASLCVTNFNNDYRWLCHRHKLHLVMLDRIKRFRI